jgi:hypothetical protein
VIHAFAKVVSLGVWERQGKRSTEIGVSGYVRAAVFDEPPPGTYTVYQRL